MKPFCKEPTLNTDKSRGKLSDLTHSIKNAEFFYSQTTSEISNIL